LLGTTAAATPPPPPPPPPPPAAAAAAALGESGASMTKSESHIEEAKVKRVVGFIGVGRGVGCCGEGTV
jgi:hypothetical protein